MRRYCSFSFTDIREVFDCHVSSDVGSDEDWNQVIIVSEVCDGGNGSDDVEGASGVGCHECHLPANEDVIYCIKEIIQDESK